MSNKSENQNPPVWNFPSTGFDIPKENSQPHLIHPLRPSIKRFFSEVDLDESNSRGPLRKKPHLRFLDESHPSILDRGFLAESNSSFSIDNESESSGSVDSDSQPLPVLAPLKLKFNVEEKEDDLSLTAEKSDAAAIKSDPTSSNSDSIIDSKTSSSASEKPPPATPDNQQRATSVEVPQAPLKKIISTPKTPLNSIKKLFE